MMGATGKNLILLSLLATLVLPACSKDSGASGIDAGTGSDTGSDFPEDCPPQFECIPEFEAEMTGCVQHEEYFCGGALVCCETAGDADTDSDVDTDSDTDTDSDSDTDADTDNDTDVDADSDSDSTSECTDEDSDSWCLPFDCDDEDSDVHPFQDEIPDNDVDDDCDGITDEGADTDTCTLEADTDFDTNTSAYLCLDDAGPETCGPVSGDFGDCDQPLGFGLDGMRCEMIEGCDCGPSDVVLYETAVDCALACGGEGHCNLCAFWPPWFDSCTVEEDFWGGDDIFVCVVEEYTATLEGMFDGITCGDDPSPWCGGDSYRCQTEYAYDLVTVEEWDELRVISLLPMVEVIVLMVYE